MSACLEHSPPVSPDIHRELSPGTIPSFSSLLPSLHLPPSLTNAPLTCLSFHSSHSLSFPSLTLSLYTYPCLSNSLFPCLSLPPYGGVFLLTFPPSSLLQSLPPSSFSPSLTTSIHPYAFAPSSPFPNSQVSPNFFHSCMKKPNKPGYFLFFDGLTHYVNPMSMFSTAL